MSNILDDIDQRIGARIRIERESRGWSLTDLAAKSTVSRAMVHKIERGESSPTATLLAKIASAFGLTMSSLLAKAEMKPGKISRVAEQPVWVDPESGYVRRHVSPRTDMPVEIIRIELPPGADIPMPASAYAMARELIWVLENALVFVEGGVRHELEAGDCLELGAPSNCVFKNETDRPSVYALVLLTDREPST